MSILNFQHILVIKVTFIIKKIGSRTNGVDFNKKS